MKSVRPITNTLLQSSSRSPILSCRAVLLTEHNPCSSNHQRQRRAFVPNPFTATQTLTATRTLQYPSKIIFDIISDVGSYSQFLPYCQSSEVTKTSSPAENGKTYPEEAKLLVGFNSGVSEEFCSRVYCVPDTVVEAVSGATVTSLSAGQIKHHSERAPADQDPARKDTVLTHLATTWKLRPFPYKPPPSSATLPSTTHKNHEEPSSIAGQDKTEVNLTIEYQFTNPVYGALSSAAAPKVADRMIEAFENRVKAVIEGPASVGNRTGRMEGLLPKSRSTP